MFVLDTEITVNYLLPHTTSNPVYTDYDIRVVQPNGDSIFYNAAIPEEDFVAPTPDTTGAVSYKFTPGIEGVWIVALSKGTAPNFEIHNEYFLRISTPDVHVHQQVVLG